MVLQTGESETEQKAPAWKLETLGPFKRKCGERRQKIATLRSASFLRDYFELETLRDLNREQAPPMDIFILSL